MRKGIHVTCAVCGNQKRPRGRSAPAQLYLCDDRCSGYDQWPHVGDLWPGETEDEFGFPVSDRGTMEVSS